MSGSYMPVILNAVLHVSHTRNMCEHVVTRHVTFVVYCCTSCIRHLMYVMQHRAGVNDASQQQCQQRQIKAGNAWALWDCLFCIFCRVHFQPNIERQLKNVLSITLLRAFSDFKFERNDKDVVSMPCQKQFILARFLTHFAFEKSQSHT